MVKNIKTNLHRKSVIKIVLISFTVILPLLMNYLIIFVYCHRFGLKNLLLNNSDEVLWQAQTAGMMKFVMPLGYFGYDGSRAAVGTLGAWGVFPFYPYVFLGRIFGWNFYSRHYFNILFLCIALLIFILMINADIKQILLVDLAYIMMPVTYAYSLTAMSESERYASAIIIVGMLIRLYKKKCSWCFKYICVPVFLLYSILCYDVMVVVIPIYVMILLRDRKPISRILWSIVTTFSAAVLVELLYTKIQAPYIEDGLIDKIMGMYSDGFIKGTLSCIWMFYRNLARFGPVNLYNICDSGHGFYSAYLAVYVIFCIFMAVCILHRIVKKGKLTTILSAAWMIFGFAMAYGCLYPGDEITLTRGINCGLIMCIFIFIASEEEKSWKVYFLLCVLMIVPASGYMRDICESGYEAAQKLPKIESERESLLNIMQVDAAASKWDNTIAFYGSLDTEYLEIPDGFGMNYMINNKVDYRMGWAVVDRGYDKAEAVILMLKNSGFRETYDNEDFYIFRRLASE